MGKCLQSQERIMILGTCSILAQPDVRAPLCQGRQPWRHPVPQQLEQGGREGGGGEGEEQQPVTACPGEPASIYSSSSSSVGRSPSSAEQLPSPHSLLKALSPPHHNVGFQVPLCHPSIIIHFFSFLTAASFALWTLTPENSPGSPEELRGYAHLGTAAVVGLCQGIVCG